MTAEARAKIGTVLVRIVVPLWIIAGATFKIVEHTPRMLPSNIFNIGVRKMGLPPYELLTTLVALEFLAIAVMVLVPKLARAMAIFMLSAFCLILIGELLAGNFTDCGCFGKVPMPPWVTLAIDGALLLGVLFFKPGQMGANVPKAPWNVVGATLATVVGAIITYAGIMPHSKAKTPVDPQPIPVVQTDPGTPVPDNGDSGTPTPTVPTDPTVNPNPTPVPGVWFTQDMDSWIGKPWRELELFKFMKQWPRDMDSDKHYVVFYRRTCDHCEEMFIYDLIDPAFAQMVTTIEIPETQDQMRPDYAWEMIENETEHLEMPMGCDWIVTTPLAIRVENGKVTCAVEGEHAECLELE